MPSSEQDPNNQSQMSPKEVAEVRAELERRVPELKERLQRLEEAKQVTQETLQLEFKV